jgi:hypothetical protein
MESSPGRPFRPRRARRAGASASIARLAGLFDPCVPYRIEVLEPAHA